LSHFLQELAAQHKWLAENLLEMVDENKSTYNKYTMYKDKYIEAVTDEEKLYNQIEFEQNRSEIQMKKANDALAELNELN